VASELLVMPVPPSQTMKNTARSRDGGLGSRPSRRCTRCSAMTWSCLAASAPMRGAISMAEHCGTPFKTDFPHAVIRGGSSKTRKRAPFGHVSCIRVPKQHFHGNAPPLQNYGNLIAAGCIGGTRRGAIAHGFDRDTRR